MNNGTALPAAKPALKFYGTADNLYHLKTESDHKMEGIAQVGRAKITGYSKEVIEPGTVLELRLKEFYTVTEVLERRDHAGVFPNPEDAKDAYFEVMCTFKRAVAAQK